MYFAENKTVETHLYFDPEGHQVIPEVFIDDNEDAYVCVSASPRDMVTEMVNEGGYTADSLDAFLDTLYEAVAILEDHLNKGEE